MDPVNAKRTSLVLGAACVLLSSVALTAGAGAASPPLATGALAFMRQDADGRFQTWVSCPDLTNARLVGNAPGSETGWPTWSPDGMRLALDTTRDDPDQAADPYIDDVYTVAADGSDLRRLTRSDGVMGAAAWSPDGSLLAIEVEQPSTGPAGIFVLDSDDGSGLRRLTTSPEGHYDSAARFDPAGDRLVFTRFLSDGSGPRLFLTPMDGGDPVELDTGAIRPGDATWSPDGAWLVFEGELLGDGDAGPWLMRPDGTDLHSLTGPQETSMTWTGYSDPVFSPDGTQVVMLRGIHQRSGDEVKAGLAVVGVDGHGMHDVGDGTGAEHQVDWSAAATC